MPADRSRSVGFALRAALALFAISVQVLIPFVIAGDVAAAEARTPPICSATDHGAPHHPKPGRGSPLCAALAVAAAITAPGEIAMPVPAGWRRLRLTVAASVIRFRAVSSSYDARGPPAAA